MTEFTSKSFHYVQTDNRLYCASCGFIAYEAIFHSPCGRIICRGCPPIPNHQCPINNNDNYFSIDQNPIYKSLFDELKVDCVNCDFIGSPNNYTKHQCQIRLFLCLLCEESVKQPERRQHQEEQCKQRLITCDICGNSGRAVDIEKHKENIYLCGVGQQWYKFFMHKHQEMIKVSIENAVIKYGLKRKRSNVNPEAIELLDNFITSNHSDDSDLETISEVLEDEKKNNNNSVVKSTTDFSEIAVELNTLNIPSLKKLCVTHNILYMGKKSSIRELAYALYLKRTQQTAV